MALADLPPLPGLSIESSLDEALAAESWIAATEIQRRLQHGNQFWLARIDGRAVGWGWCAREVLSIGELGIERALPLGNRYLWDFFTTPAWRGRGIYPRLLQAIVTRDTAAERFWLGHDMGNHPSHRGIAKAGFHEVGSVYRQPNGALLLIPTGDGEHAAAASTLFAIPLADVHRVQDL